MSDIQLYKKVKSMKTAGWWSIFGWLLFGLPGFIASIVFAIKLFTHKTSNSKVLGIVGGILTLVLMGFLIGPILGLVYAYGEGRAVEAESRAHSQQHFQTQPQPAPQPQPETQNEAETNN